MVISVMIDCSNRSQRSYIRCFFAFQLLLKGQGEQMHPIMEAQQRAWLIAISRDDLIVDK